VQLDMGETDMMLL